MAKQQRIPGTENSIKELDALGYEYKAVQTERMDALKKEVELKEKLMSEMHNHKLKTYKYEDLTIILEPGEESIKVKIAKKKEQD